MNDSLRRIRSIIQSFEGYDVQEGIDRTETMRIGSKIKLTVSEHVKTVTGAPQGIPSFKLRKPDPLKSSLNSAKRLSANHPIDLLKEELPHLLEVPSLSTVESSQTSPLAYRARTRRVVDRVETQACAVCSGEGHINQERTENIEDNCVHCGATGRVAICTPQRSSAHGPLPDVNYSWCMHCSGTGRVVVGSQIKRESVSCTSCGGTGSTTTTHYRKAKVYETHAVSIQAKVISKSKQPKLFTRLKKIVGSETFSVERLFMLGSSQEPSFVKERRKQVDLQFDFNVPFTQFSVTRNGKHVGDIYYFDYADEPCFACLKPFMDKELRKLRKKISRMRRDSFKRDLQDNFLAKQFEEGVARGESLEPDIFSFRWLFTAKELKRCELETKKCLGRGPSLFKRLFSKKP